MLSQHCAKTKQNLVSALIYDFLVCQAHSNAKDKVIIGIAFGI